MNTDELQKEILSRLYRAYFAQRRAMVAAEDVAQDLGLDAKHASRAADELSHRGFVRVPFLNRDRHEMLLTTEGILEAERLNLADESLLRRQQDLRDRVTQVYARLRAEHGPSHMADFLTIVQNLGFAEEEFKNNSDVLVRLGYLSHYKMGFYRVGERGFSTWLAQQGKSS